MDGTIRFIQVAGSSVKGSLDKNQGDRPGFYPCSGHWPSRLSLYLSLALCVDYLPSTPSMRHLKSEDILLSNQQCLFLSNICQETILPVHMCSRQNKLQGQCKSRSPEKAKIWKLKRCEWVDSLMSVRWLGGIWNAHGSLKRYKSLCRSNKRS